jgi:hypothetical protein
MAVGIPTVYDLAEFIARDLSGDEEAAQAQQVITIVTSLVKSYTRGNGFDSEGSPAEDLRAVILTSSARLIFHQFQVPYAEVKGPESFSVREGWVGWTLTELAALNRWRIRAL